MTVRDELIAITLLLRPHKAVESAVLNGAHVRVGVFGPYQRELTKMLDVYNADNTVIAWHGSGGDATTIYADSANYEAVCTILDATAYAVDAQGNDVITIDSSGGDINLSFPPPSSSAQRVIIKRRR